MTYLSTTGQTPGPPASAPGPSLRMTPGRWITLMIGVPIALANLGGIDSLLAMVQMPKGIPVATFAIGKPGAGNVFFRPASSRTGLTGVATAGASGRRCA